MLTIHTQFSFQAYNRVKSRKSKLANDVLNLVKNHFAGSSDLRDPKDIREYVCSAIGRGGSAYYAKLKPKEAVASDKENGEKTAEDVRGSNTPGVRCLTLKGIGAKRLSSICVHCPSCEAIPLLRFQLGPGPIYQS